MSWWRVSYFDAGLMGHFEDVDAPSKEAAAWKVAMQMDSNHSVLADVRAIDQKGNADG